jgi:hypothetical protein
VEVQFTNFTDILFFSSQLAHLLLAELQKAGDHGDPNQRALRQSTQATQPNYAGQPKTQLRSPFKLCVSLLDNKSSFPIGKL